MRRILILLAGCGTDPDPPIDVVPCTAFATQSAITGGCRVDLRGVDWSTFSSGPVVPYQLRPDDVMDGMPSDNIDNFDICEAMPAMWDGDAEAGAVVFVGQHGVAVTADDLTCAWVRCLEPR